MSKIHETIWHSWSNGKLPKGCELCVKGKKLVLFITGLCSQRCFYCPVSEQKFGNDVIFANEWKVSSENAEELIKEAELTEAEGAGITGGDPLMKVDRCCQYIKILKSRFGKKFHIHLYTPLKLVDEEKLQKLHDAGLDEIRFHLDLNDSCLWSRVELAKKHKWSIGVEIPAIPGYEIETAKAINFVSNKVDFINFNELERSDTKTQHYKIDEFGFNTINEISYAIEGSAEIGMKMLREANKKGLKAHFCTAKLKDKVQMGNRIKIRARNIAESFDEITDEGLLSRGCVYLPELSPVAGYREKMKNADKNEMIEKLEEKQKIIEKEIKCRAVVDKTKLRLIIPKKSAQNNSEKIKKMKLIPAVVEEYPTADAIEMSVEFL